MTTPHQIPQRQLDTGPASWFRPEAMSPAANQIRVKAGYVFSGAEGVRVPNPAISGFPQDQLTAGFAVVAPGTQRYDLAYLTPAGVATILQGTAVPFTTAFPQGAPGWEGTNPGPAIPDNAIPVAWVFVTETASVSIAAGDITQIDGFLRVTRDLDGYLIDKGLKAGAFVGSTSIVTTLFAAEAPNGGTLVRGVITSPPLNVVHLLDQKGDQMEVGFAGPAAALGARLFGRLTEAAGVWTLSFLALDTAGAEIAIAPATDLTAVPTSIRLAGTPKVYARGDSVRPLFASAQATISDQVAGDIPYATTTTDGKVRLAADNGTGASLAVQGSDSRLAQATTVQRGTVFASRVTGDKAGEVSRVQGATGAQGDFFGIHTINFSAATAGQVTNPSPGVVNITATGAPGPTGPSGPAGPPGPTGPTGPGFSSLSSYNSSGVSTGPGSFSFTHTYGFTPKSIMAGWASIHDNGTFDNQDTIAITNVSVSGNDGIVAFNASGPAADVAMAVYQGASG